MLSMAMTLRLTDTETEALRKQADAEHRSMQDVARAAVREYVARRSHETKVDEAIHDVVTRHAHLLKRLGDA